MFYITLVVCALLLWWWLRRALSELWSRLNEISAQLERVQKVQQETFVFVCDAVDEFAIISGETKEEDTERERLSNRILELRRQLEEGFEKGDTSG